jgi:hypothetical protein
MFVSVVNCRRARPGAKRLSRYANPQGFGALKLQENRALTPFANASAFGALSIITPGQATVTRFANAQSFGALKFQGNRTLTEFISPESFVGGLTMEVPDVGDPWKPATMTTPPSVAGGTWTTAYATSSSPTPVFEDFTSGISGVRLRVLTTAGNGAVKVYGVTQPRPGAAYDLIARFRLQRIVTSSFNRCGLFLRESATSKVMIFGLNENSDLVLNSYSSLTAGTNFVNIEGGNGMPFDFWLKIHDDHAGTGGSGHLTFYSSLDGNYFSVVKPATGYNATGLDFTSAPDQVGFGFDARDANVDAELVLECGSFFAG